MTSGESERKRRSAKQDISGPLHEETNSEQSRRHAGLIGGDKPRSSTETGKRDSLYAMLSRVVVIVLISLLVATSLLTFPSSIPWMIAFWLAMYTVLAARGKPAWVPLLACIAILLVKGIYWPSSLALFAGAAGMVAVVRFARRTQAASYPRVTWVATLGLWVLWGTVTAQWHAIATCGRAPRFHPSRSVVCLGNSLTAGVPPDRGYPAQLRKMIRPPVINLGQPGITTEDGLERLPKVAEVDPPAQAVIIELGGHDFLKGRTRAATKANLTQLVDQCHKLGATVVLLEIPRGFITDPFWGLEREIAHEQDVQLVADSAIRQLVVWSPIAPPGMWMPGSHLSDDGIHTNRRGSEFLARQVADALQHLYGPEIRNAE